jgi:hypothetical protein
MKEFISQIRAASAGGLYYLALFGALAIPDIFGALGSENGKASGPKYRAWVEENVPGQGQAKQAAELYGLRCSLMHQGRTIPHGTHFPIAFMAPGAGQLRNLSTVVGDSQIGWISIEMLVEEITTGAEEWLEKFGQSQIVQRNMERFARLRVEGLPPHAQGPVIA